jgi:uncharacterized membrane-anchored protein YhcB (DUF1043 family)
MMWQYLIVFLAIGWALGISIYRLSGFFRKPESHCSSCAMQADNCQLKELKDALPKKFRHNIS